MSSTLKKLFNSAIEEFKSYPKNIRISLYIMSFFVAGFIVFGLQIFIGGLGYTDMDNTYPFGQWIIGDLGLVALGGGAFTIGFFLYILRNKKLEPLINSTVLIGFLCYLFTFVFLVFDIGQPLRAWFGFTYPNWGTHIFPNSMLTEVVWCLSVYFIILCIELTPIALKHRILDNIPFLHHIGHFLHKIMWIFALLGTCLSFFHQASLGGGMWGVLYAKVSWFRPHFFYLAVVGAIAGGTSFMALCVYMASKIMKKELAPRETYQSIAKISGYTFIFFFAFQIYDVISMSVKYIPSFDRKLTDLMGGYYGWWMLILTLGFSALAMIFLSVKRLREKEKFLFMGLSSGMLSIVMCKLNTVLSGSSVPNFPWSEFSYYNPTIQEWFITIGGLSIMAMIYMWCAKYLPLFPHAEEK